MMIEIKLNDDVWRVKQKMKICFSFSYVTLAKVVIIFVNSKIIFFALRDSHESMVNLTLLQTVLQMKGYYEAKRQPMV